MMKTKKSISFFIALIMLFCSFTVITGAEETAGSVYISLEDFGDRDYLREYCKEDDIAYPEPFGVIVPETEVPVYEGESIAEAVIRFLEMNNISHAYSGNAELGGGFYLHDISFYWEDEYIEVFGEGSITPNNGELYYNSGWMHMINNCYPSSGISDYEANDGDIIRIRYTCAMGADIGNDFSLASAKMTGIDLDKKYGSVSPEFAADIKEYTLFLNEDVDSVKLGVQNENYSSVVTYSANGTEYKFMRDIPVDDKTVITVKSEYFAADPPEYTPYLADTDEISIKVVKSTLREDIKAVFDAKLKHESFFNRESVGTTSGDWIALALARFGAVAENGEIRLLYNAALADYADAAEKNLRELFEKNGAAASRLTDYFRSAVTLAALGRDASDIIKAVIADNDTELSNMSVTALAYGLISLSVTDIDIGENPIHTAEDFVDALLSLQHKDGGWSLQADLEADSDVDVTAVVLQALAPFYKENSKAVASAVNKALNLLSVRQKSSGDFSSYGVFNAESCAQVIIALTHLGIDVLSDSRFIKDGNSVLDGLLLYRLSDGSFTHSLISDEENSSVTPGEYNYLATDQAALALVALWREQKGLNSLYNMRPDPAEGTESLDHSLILSLNSTPKDASSTTEKIVISAVSVIAAAALVIVFIKMRKKKNQ